MMLLLQCSGNVVTSVYLKYGSIEIITKQQWNWSLVENKQNKRMTETLIVNTLSGDKTELTLCCCCFWFSFFGAVTAEIIWIKIVKDVPTLLFVVAAVVLWYCVNFCKYTRWKYHHTRIMKTKQKVSIHKTKQYYIGT